MADYHSDHTAARPGRDAWRHDNERGLALAADADWVEASEAFAAAADSLARALPSETRDVHEPLALVLLNLSQAYFRLGRIDDAMQQAQRACALRVAIAGEDGMPVARARMDLAVMLATAGRLDEATALVQRAIAGIEHRVGEEDARLVVVLENAARIALASGAPANAEPLLLRLHALLDAHDLSPVRAAQLLARVAEGRSPNAAPATVAAETPVGSHVATDDLLASFDEDAQAPVYAHVSIAEQAEWDDQPLRDAVAVTDVLLRTTPSGVPIIPAPALVEPPNLEVGPAATDEADAMLDVMDFTDVLPAPTLREPAAASMLSLEPTDATSPLDALDLDLDLDLVLADAPLEAEPDAETRLVAPEETVLPEGGDVAAGASGGFMLDFTVEHGLIDDDPSLWPGAPVPSPEIAQAITQAITQEIAPVPPSPPSPPPVQPPTQPPVPLQVESERPQPVVSPPRPPRRTPEEMVVLPPPASSSGSGGRIAIIVTAIAAIGGAAAFFLLR